MSSSWRSASHWEARAFAARHRYAIDANQELIALGAANLGAELMQGFTVDASLSNSASADAAGARSQVSSIVTAALIVVTLVAFAGLFRNLPTAVLGAIVIVAVVGLMDVDELKRFYRVRRTDFWLAMTALVGVVLSTVLTGLLLAGLLSLVIVLYRASQPDIAVLGKIPGQRASYGDVARHPENERTPGLVIFRLDAPLYFFNVTVARQRMLDLVAGSDPPAKAVLLDLGSSVDLDIATLDALRELLTTWREAGVLVLFAQVRGPVRDVLRRTDLLDLIGAERLYGSVHAALLAFTQERTGETQLERERDEGDDDPVRE